MNRVGPFAEPDRYGSHRGLILNSSGLLAPSFENLMQPVDERGEALVASINRDVRDFAVKRIAHFVQLIEPRTRIGSLQERAILVIPRALSRSLTLALR